MTNLQLELNTSTLPSQHLIELIGGESKKDLKDLKK